jgi:hypothetical protein
VFAYPSYPEMEQDLVSNYGLQLGMQTFDGQRDDCFVSQISSAIEGIDGSGNAFWLVFECTGRLCRLDFTGAATTLVGLRLNRNLLPYPTHEMPNGSSLTESDYNTRLESIGVIDPLGTTATPSFGDLRGQNDGCYDPRDATHNTLFIANTLNHDIIKVTGLLSGTPHMVRYAGQDLGLGARLTNPTIFRAISRMALQPSLLRALRSRHSPARSAEVS